MTRTLALASLLFASCGFQQVGGNDDAAIGDLAGADDLGGADLTGASTDAGMPCPLPHLLIAVDNSASTAVGGGQVMRLPLGGAGVCTTLTGRGTLGAHVSATAFVAPDQVAVAWNGGVALIDSATDSARWIHVVPGAPHPIDVFPIVAAQTYVGVGYNNLAPMNQVETIELYHDASGPAFKWQLDGANFPVGNVFGVTQNPLAAGRLFMLVVGSSPLAAADVDPFQATSTPYVTYPPSTKLGSIYSSGAGGALRTVWTDLNQNALYYTKDAGANPPVLGPLACAGRTCLLLHAVPDPTDPDGFFATCADTSAPNAVSVVHLSSVSPTCSLIFDPATLAQDLLITRLAVAR